MIGILILAVLAGVGILTSSGKANEKTYWQERAQQSKPATHEPVINDPSGGAWVLALIVAFVFCVVALQVG